MTTFSSYTHFVADQVLTASHLNGLFNYLDEQNRLTRNKLLGIGIVCGLEYEIPTTSFLVSKGTGITSAGYLIAEAARTLTHYRPTPYVLPDDFLEIETDYGFPYSLWKDHMYELVPNDTSIVKAGDLPIAGNLSFLNDKILVYLLEKKTTDLKNCTSNDCDDKGERVDFTLKPLLVDKSAVDASNHLFSNTARIFPEVDLKRIALPNTVDAEDVLDAFKAVYLDNTTLQQLDTGLATIYSHFAPLFPSPNNVNPFSGFITAFTNRVNSELSNNVFSFQYFYDWLDDLIKAYNEFALYASQVVSECCPSEGLFPMHLLLGEASKSSQTSNMAYRSHFIYSGLFQPNHSGRLHLKSLIGRIIKLFNYYETFTIEEMRTQAIEITPSTWSKALLSERCIPFYYTITEVLKPWNYNLTRLGKEKRNLSYNAPVYATDDAVLNPLDYDIERNDFYRIEGHVGKRISTAYKEITTMRDDFNLPFDVVALNLSKSKINLRNISEDDIQCAFKDLESAYRVYISGLMEDLHKSVCFITHLPLLDVKVKSPLGNMTGGASSGTSSGAGNATEAEKDAAMKEFGRSLLGGCFKHSNTLNYAEYIDEKYENGYSRGDYISEIFTPIPATVGDEYLDIVASGSAVPTPQMPTGTDIGAILVAFYSRALYFLELAEQLIQQLCEEAQLMDLNEAELEDKIHKFEALCQQLKNELLIVIGLLALITKEDAEKNTHLPEFIMDLEFDLFLDELEMLLDMGFEEKIQTLLNELKKRKQQIAIQFSLGGYRASHPGLEHKAGVPRGGTFVLLYSYVRDQKNPDDPEDTEDEPDDVDFPCDDSKDNYHRGKRYKKRNDYYEAAYGNARGKKKNSKEEYENIRKRYKKQGAVIADLYLPYLCCGGCGSPVVVERKPGKEKPEIVNLQRTVKWKEKISLIETVKENTDDEKYANIVSIVEPDALTIVNNEIINAPNTTNSYIIKYKALVDSQAVGVVLFLTIMGDDKGEIRTEEISVKACVGSGKINVLEYAKEAGYDSVSEIRSSGGLSIDPDTFDVSNLPSKDEVRTVKLVVKAGDEEVRLNIEINFFKPDAAFEMVVTRSAVNSAFQISVSTKDVLPGHDKRIFVLLTNGVKTVEVKESNDVITIEKISDFKINVKVSTLNKFAEMLRKLNIDPVSGGIQIVVEDAIIEMKDACKDQKKSEIVSRELLEEYNNEMTSQEGKKFVYQ